MRVIPYTIIFLTALASSQAMGQKVDWLTYGFDLARSGYNPNENLLGPSNVASLQQAWAFDAAKFARSLSPPPPITSGHFRAQPLVATNVTVGGNNMDLVLVGDNDGLFFALDANSSSSQGSIVWTRQIPTVKPACTSASISGILGTATVDRSAGPNGAVYVAANALVYAWDLATGATIPGWPDIGLQIPHLTQDVDGFIHSGLTLVGHSLYVTNASKCDFGSYHGQIALIDTNAVSVTDQWFTMSGNGSVPSQLGGAIWNPGGVSIDVTASQPLVYTATGNAKPNGPATETLPYAEAIVKLKPNLSDAISTHTPGYLDRDDDIASTATLFSARNCSPAFVAVEQKFGAIYIFQRNHINTTSPQTIQLANTHGQLRGGPAWDPVAQLLLFTSPADGPSPFTRGLIALQQTSQCQFGLAWDTSNDMAGNPIIPQDTPLSPPSIANGVVYFAPVTGNNVRVYAVADQNGGGASAGQVLWESQVYGGGVQEAPSIVNGRLFVATYDGKVYAYSLPGH